MLAEYYQSWILSIKASKKAFEKYKDPSEVERKQKV